MAMDNGDGDIEKEVKDELKYRLRSPFYASFLIAFVVCNWRAVLVMLYPATDLSLGERFVWVEQLYPDSQWVRLVLLPLVSACVAVAFIPWGVNYLDDLRYWALVKRKNNRMQRDEKLLKVQATIAELTGGMNEVRRLLTEANDKVIQKDAEINSLIRMRDDLHHWYKSALLKALGHDKDLMKKFRSLTDTGNALEIGKPPAVTLVSLGLVVQRKDGRQDLTEIGIEVRDYIRQHIVIPG